MLEFPAAPEGVVRVSSEKENLACLSVVNFISKWRIQELGKQGRLNIIETFIYLFTYLF